jgi:hypothetical protein
MEKLAMKKLVKVTIVLIAIFILLFLCGALMA